MGSGQTSLGLKAITAVTGSPTGKYISSIGGQSSMSSITPGGVNAVTVSKNTLKLKFTGTNFGGSTASVQDQLRSTSDYLRQKRTFNPSLLSSSTFPTVSRPQPKGFTDGTLTSTEDDETEAFYVFESQGETTTNTPVKAEPLRGTTTSKNLDSTATSATTISTTRVTKKSTNTPVKHYEPMKGILFTNHLNIEDNLVPSTAKPTPITPTRISSASSPTTLPTLTPSASTLATISLANLTVPPSPEVNIGTIQKSFYIMDTPGFGKLAIGNNEVLLADTTTASQNSSIFLKGLQLNEKGTHIAYRLLLAGVSGPTISPFVYTPKPSNDYNIQVISPGLPLPSYANSPPSNPLFFVPQGTSAFEIKADDSAAKIASGFNPNFMFQTNVPEITENGPERLHLNEVLMAKRGDNFESSLEDARENQALRKIANLLQNRQMDGSQDMHNFYDLLKHKKSSVMNNIVKQMEKWHIIRSPNRVIDDDEDVDNRGIRSNSKPTAHFPKIWDQWGKWSACSATCGAGKMTRWRHCVAGGCAPGEKEAQIKTCVLPPCV